MKTNRELALEWWDNLSEHNQCKMFFNLDFYTPCISPNQLTGREIELIWKKEIQVLTVEEEHFIDPIEPLVTLNDDKFYDNNRMFLNHIDPKESEDDYEESEDIFSKHKGSSFFPKEPQVDFEMLNNNIKDIIQLLKESTIKEEEINNFQLFFKLLSTKPTFAQKTYKELNKCHGKRH